MTIRTSLNEATSERLLQIMEYYGFGNTNHTLNVIIGSLHQSLFKHTPENEVNINEPASKDHH